MATTSPGIRLPGGRRAARDLHGLERCAPPRSLETTSVIRQARRSTFRQTKADRLAVGDPRLSIEERYPTHQNT